jgi:predicted RNase H-like nuclease (RuvC/YqgF family)
MPFDREETAAQRQVEQVRCTAYNFEFATLQLKVVELMARVGQLRDENSALQQKCHSAEDVVIKNHQLAREFQALRVEHASVEKQLRSMQWALSSVNPLNAVRPVSATTGTAVSVDGHQPTSGSADAGAGHAAGNGAGVSSPL